MPKIANYDKHQLQEFSGGCIPAPLGRGTALSTPHTCHLIVDKFDFTRRVGQHSLVVWQRL